MVLLDAVRIVPIEHAWHAALVAAVEGLRSTGTPVVELEVSEYSPAMKHISISKGLTLGFV
jgi:hypothetical protein